MAGKTLNPRQDRFVHEYLIDLNANQAAIRAGYAEKTARHQAARLLANVNIQAAISEAQKQRSRRTEITQDRVLQEYARLGFSDMRNYVSWGPDGIYMKPSDELSEDEARAVVEVSETTTEIITEKSSKVTTRVQFKLASKQQALDSMAKHLGMFTDATYIDNRQQTLIQVFQKRLEAKQDDAGG